MFEQRVAVLAFGAKVTDKQRHAVAHTFDAAVTVFGTMLGLDKVEIRPRYIRVRDDKVGGVKFTVRQADALCFAVLYNDFFDLGVELQIAAQFLNQFCKAIHQRARAAHDVMDAPFAFEMMNEDIEASNGLPPIKSG